ncbi:MAG: lysozyme [Pseudomonadota bacterium]
MSLLPRLFQSARRFAQRGEAKLRLLPVMLALSAGGLVGIGLHEGYRGQAYDDGHGVQTVGFGSTEREDGTPVRPGDKTTPERALVRLADHVEKTEAAMRACMGPVPLFQHEWDAYVSLAYNIGPAAFCRSTLVRKLKQTPPDYAAACAEILRWNRAGGQVLAGLVKRREAEYRLCVGGISPSPQPSPARGEGAKTVEIAP